MLGADVRAKQKQLQVVSRVDDSLPAILSGDEIRIKQVLNNILSKMFDYQYNIMI